MSSPTLILAVLALTALTLFSSKPNRTAIRLPAILSPPSSTTPNPTPSIESLPAVNQSSPAVDNLDPDDYDAEPADFNPLNTTVTPHLPSHTIQPSHTLGITTQNFTPPPNSTKAQVTRVIDGDTIEIESGAVVRYIGIDTPESVHPQKPVQCFGKEATTRNKQLVEGQAVYLVKDVSDTDRYGRLLRYVYTDQAFVNYQLVAEGFANSSAYPPDIAHQSQFQVAQENARQQSLGLWNSCQSSSPLPDRTPADSQSCPIKGNISSGGEKIYHLPTCPYYSRTKIDLARGERYFCTEDEALKNDWRKAGNCP